MKDRYFYIIVLAMLASGVAIRAMPLLYQTFYEPDVFFHYAVMLQAVTNHYSIPLHFSLSNNALLVEPHGLYYITLIPYYFLHRFISLYNLIRIIPLAYFVLFFAAFCYLTGLLSKNREFRLLVLLIFTLLTSNLLRTIATEYRGDGFIGIFIILSLAFMLESYNRESYLYAFASAFVLSFANTVWNGGTFAYAVYCLAVLVLVCYNFARANSKKLKHTAILGISSILYVFLIFTYYAAGIIITPPSMLLYLGSTLAVCAIAFASYRLSRMKINARTRRNIIIAAIAVSVVAALAFGSTYDWSGFYRYFQNYGGYPTAYLTIHELQPPSISSIITLDNVVSLVTPAFWPLFLSTLLPVSLKYLIFIMLLGMFVLYCSTLTGEKSKEPLLVMLSYFAVAAFLDAFIVRAIILLAVPASFAIAYTIYWSYLITKENRYGLIFVRTLTITFLVIFLMDALYVDHMLWAPATVSPAFLGAAVWLRNNTPANSVVITNWPDGSVVAGWADRDATQTSVANQGTNNSFPIWLLSSSFNVSPLRNEGGYFLVRTYMPGDSQICIDAGIYNCTGLKNLNGTPYESTNLYRILRENETPAGTQLVYRNNDSMIFKIK